MKTLAAWLMLCGCALADDRFGVVTHFDHQAPFANSPNYGQAPSNEFLQPMLAQEGIGWVRDDINWGEESPGGPATFTMDGKQAWLNACQANGQKVVALIDENVPAADGGPNWPTDAANQAKIMTDLPKFCAAMVQAEPMIAVIEVGNEIQNKAAFQGTAGMQFAFNLTNAVADAVHAVAPNVKVIGIDMQGDQILQTLALGTPHFDGVVYHPYDPNTFIPEDQYTNVVHDTSGVRIDNNGKLPYMTWINRLRQATSLPIWETERAISNGGREGDYWSANWEARRTIMTYWLGIPHTFMYQGCADQGNDKQSYLSYNQEPRGAVFVHQRLSQELPAGFTQGATPIEATSDPNSANFLGLTFVYPSTTVAAVWIANQQSLGVPIPNAVSITVSPVPAGANNVLLYYPLSGVVASVTGSTLNGNSMTVPGVPISTEPVLIEVSVAASGAPSSITIGSDVWTFSTTTNSGGNIIFRNGQSANGAGVLATNISGQLYVLNLTGSWYKWVGVGNGYQGSGWSGVGVPSMLGSAVICAP